MGFFLETLIGGLMTGMLYSLVALGFVLIFKASGVFNFAQGAMVLFAALAMARFSEWVPKWLGFESLLLANLVAFALAGVVMFAVAWLIERLVLGKLVNQEGITLLMATLGIAYFMDGFGQTLFGSDIYKIDVGLPKDPIFLLESTFPGGLLVNKESLGGSRHFNRTMGADANFNFSSNVQINSYIAKTSTPGRDGKDMAELKDEMQMLKAQGHQGFKAKVGGVSLKEDMKRLELIRDIIGPDKDMMVDVNRAWDLPTAITAAREMLPLNPRWLEEPVRWADDHRELIKLAQQTNIPLSAGESELTAFGCRDLVEDGAIQILQFDCTMMGGFTTGRKLAALCELNQVQVAPHHDCFIHAHIVAGSPAGCIVESFTDPERDPLQAELFLDPPTIADEIGSLHTRRTPRRRGCRARCLRRCPAAPGAGRVPRRPR